MKKTKKSLSKKFVRQKSNKIHIANEYYEIKMLFFITLAVYNFIALYTFNINDPGFFNSSLDSTVTNFGGVIGAYLSNFQYNLFGLSAWFFILYLLILSMHCFFNLLEKNWMFQNDSKKYLFGLILLIISISSLQDHRIPFDFNSSLTLSGGLTGSTLNNFLIPVIGNTGTLVFLTFTLLIGISTFFGFSWLMLSEKIGFSIEFVFIKLRFLYDSWLDKKIGKKASIERDSWIKRTRKKLQKKIPLSISTKKANTKLSKKAMMDQQTVLFDTSNDDFPKINLLDSNLDHTIVFSKESIEYTSRLIEKKLLDFGVEVSVISAEPGPVITRYEIDLATGVKGSQIINLSKDLARALSVETIRIVETIPGKTFMGLEIPNEKRNTVKLSEIISSELYNSKTSKLTLALGKDISGLPVVDDLSKMPHLLVAGTTGSGKSVAVNAMILSFLYKATAEEIRMIFIDPKMLELSVYEGIPHLLCPVITDMRDASKALNWCVQEMDYRYRLMSTLGVRSIASYNQKISQSISSGERIPNPFSNNESSSDENDDFLEPFPLIVVVIDELADLMMVVGKKIEELIARLAQKARAAGIHLILATQRPSVDVITGLIKANVPTRIAFQVSSKIDSRTIIDQMGAEQLLGKGDMLYLPPGSPYPQRIHGAFVSDAEVHKVVKYLKSRFEPNYIDSILNPESSAHSEFDGLEIDNEKDPLYDKAVNIVLTNKKASISLVQRHLRIGYNRAARLIETMESSGLVSAMKTNGTRDILIKEK